MTRPRVLIASLALAVLWPAPAAAQPKPGVPRITVKKDDWGDAPPDNIAAVCRSVAGELVPFFPRRKFEPIVVGRSKGSPIVIYGLGDKGERRVNVNVKGTHWAQFAYQFGHEMGHILCNYREAKNPNLWFEEALCETASIFAMRRMAKSWKTRPPYTNWSGYADALDSYARDYVRTQAKLERGTSPKWLKENEADLRKIDRPKIHSVAAHVLLPLIEKSPERLEALNWLNRFDPKKELTFAEYLADWHGRVPAAHKPFVADIAAAFGVPLKKGA